MEGSKKGAPGYVDESGMEAETEKQELEMK